MPSDGPRARTEFFHRVRAIDTALEADVNLAYARVTAENEAHLNRLKHTRSVTAVISSFMAVLGLALAVLTRRPTATPPRESGIAAGSKPSCPR